MIKATVAAIQHGDGNQTTTTLTAPGLQITVVDQPSSQPVAFEVGQGVYLAVIDADSIGGHALSAEDALVHDIMDLVDVPRHIGGQALALWQRLAHAATVAKLNLTAHVEATQAAVAAEMSSIKAAIQPAPVSDPVAVSDPVTGSITSEVGKTPAVQATPVIAQADGKP